MKKFKYIFIILYIFFFMLLFLTTTYINNLQNGIIIREIRFEQQELKTEFVLIYDKNICKNEIKKIIINFQGEKIFLSKKELIFKNNKIYVKHKNLDNLQDFKNNVVIYLNNENLLKYILKYFKTKRQV